MFLSQESKLNPSTLEKPNMQSLMSVLTSMRHGLVVTRPSIIQTAKITTLKLNKCPLPKQPVPDLIKTATRYLRSLKPLLNEKEYANTEKIVYDFVSENGIGSQLHKKLMKRFEQTNNWMSEWWLHSAYLGYRNPVIVHSSPGTVGPIFPIRQPDDVYILAARVIAAIFDYNNLVHSGQVKQETIRETPLDMQPYAMVLGTHRQPAKTQDRLIHTDNTKHIIVICNNHFFKLTVVTNSGISSEDKLAAAIKDIMDRSCALGKPVGILTGNDRDTWASDYDILLGLGDNKNIVKDIESSLFVLCLDKGVPKGIFRKKNNASIRALQAMTGINSRLNAANRWHDKTVQYIVSADGFVGMEYEHSPCEGVPIAVLHDHVIKYIYTKENDAVCGNSEDFARAELLKFTINDSIQHAIEEATNAVDKLCDDIDMECFTFNEFGTDTIKQLKLSPDSFIQIAMQVTFFKLHGKPPAHYESAALRRFRDARTECIRSTSIESVQFAKAITSSDESTKKKQLKEAMVTAINTHKAVAAEAAMAEGVDRHLFGLRMIAQSEGIGLPELYKDIGYIKSTHFTLTSSQVPYKTASFMCYGPVVPDGYGCCYNPRPNDILVSCSSFNSCKDTNTKKFACVLQETLSYMRELGTA